MEVLRHTTRIRVEPADLTTLAVDAIVNAANATLRMGGGVAGAIRRAGGPEIEQEAVARGPIRPGEAVLTGAGRLPARHVIHAATMGPDLRTDLETVQRATRAALELAEAHGLRSIAFPALGTGVGGLPFDQVAQAMLEVIAAHVDRGTALREIVLAVRGREAEEAFTQAARRFATPV